MVDGRVWADAEVGLRLAPLSFPISFKTLMLEAAGTRDFMPYHHNREYAKATGSRDAFVNTMFLQALFARYVADWSGPDSQPVSATLTMVSQLCVGDVAEVSGAVTRTWIEGPDALVEFQLAVASHLGRTAVSTAVIAMPRNDGAPVRVRSLTPEHASASDGHIPAEARAQLGRVTVTRSPYPVSEAQIMYWCEMVRDANPLFQDAGYARASRFGGITAPPASLMIWSKDRATQIGVDSMHPDVDLPAQLPWPAPAPAPSGGYRMRLATQVIAQNIVSRFGAPIRPGDLLTMSSEMTNCSPLKRTKLGLGYFVTFRDTYSNQNDEVVGDVTKTILQYGVQEKGGEGTEPAVGQGSDRRPPS